MSIHGGAHDAVGPVVRRWLDQQLATSRIEECVKMFGHSARHRSLIAKPLRKHFGVGHGCFPIAEHSADLGAIALPGTSCCIEAVMRHASHAELLDYLTDSAWFDFLGLIGKPAMCPVKQQQQGKVHPVRPALGHDEYMIRRRQCPAIGDVRSVDFQFAKFLSFVKMLLRGVFRVNAVLQK
jgi:hypothetical protein